MSQILILGRCSFPGTQTLVKRGCSLVVVMPTAISYIGLYDSAILVNIYILLPLVAYVIQGSSIANRSMYCCVCACLLNF